VGIPDNLKDNEGWAREDGCRWEVEGEASSGETGERKKERERGSNSQKTRPKKISDEGRYVRQEAAARNKAPVGCRGGEWGKT